MDRTRSEPLGVGAGQIHAQTSQGPDTTEQPSTLDRWLAAQLAKRFDSSRLRVALWDEPDATSQEPLPVVVRIGDSKALRQLVSNPDLNFGDLYSAGRITVQGDLVDVVLEAYRAAEQVRIPGKRLLRASRRPVRPGLADSKRNIHHHYDIGNDFYTLWLDSAALQYTCAYYADPAMTIEQAQQAKMHHVCRKVRLQAGERVVEAGSGWGGFALFMAKNYGVRVRSFNISREQVNYSREWARREGLEDQVEFVEDDYRNISGEYDAFLSIGMLEHVGPGNYEELGRLMKNSLVAEGRGLVHSIGRDRSIPLNAWIDRRIFPGAHPPTLREMMDLFETQGLSVLDVENLRLHYAETLRAWLDRYEQNIDRVRDMFDESFVRAWRLYLAGSRAAFLHGTLQLFQVLFAPSGMNRIPWTRAHVYQT